MYFTLHWILGDIAIGCRQDVIQISVWPSLLAPYEEAGTAILVGPILLQIKRPGATQDWILFFICSL